MNKVAIITLLAISIVSCTKKEKLPPRLVPEKFQVDIVHKETAYGGHSVRDDQYSGIIYTTSNGADTTITVTAFRYQPLIFKVDYNTVSQEIVIANAITLSGQLKYNQSSKHISISVYDGGRHGVDYSTAEGKAIE
jgi:ABC-type Na+ efflux pump permease subunit